ncbi:hypothetical protein AN189_17910 [Loktanella sp. 3ANDIMAR09]|uniref:hypothetical protein n=1 Tax=Loktanella sp. 3ANDIMAR09 TaxID=1225657 RepID=UPI0006FD3FC1|nr:hypothetical protein [Loktanella sp. 3ANDIMAR09]KQI67002.1 hypothetical protein AN189_17910 [Loktanella sp. 3ANDIMAR09]
MTGLLQELPEAVAARLKEVLPATRTCKGITGRFNLERLKSDAIQTPAVLVSILDIKQADTAAGAFHTFDLAMAAFIVTKDALGLDRDAAAAAMMGALATAVPDRRWGRPDCGQARNVRGQSVVTAGWQKSAASLWAVTWTQPCTFDPAVEDAPLGVDLYVGQSPDIGADHINEYTRIGEAR